MQIKTDTHIHTVTSVHATPTIEECVIAAHDAGLEAIAITDHCSHKMSQFEESVNAILAQEINDVMYGVHVLRGAEVDFVDYKGHIAFYNIPYDSEKTALDLLCEKSDIIIASPHFPPEDRVGSYDEITDMFLGAVADPRVTTLGHPERVWADFDLTTVVLAASQNHTFMELNVTSLSRGYWDMIKKQLTLCKDFGCPVIVNSDAHVTDFIGAFENGYKILNEVDFPAELICNLDYNKLRKELTIQKELKGR